MHGNSFPFGIEVFWMIPMRAITLGPVEFTKNKTCKEFNRETNWRTLIGQEGGASQFF
jgi:hypothetical protein